ncbi:hypothetical protein FISHEDRAFT_41589 [Fistulina hepatica ATCC 64428]|nr:hypothetical protein FISHEDRAFT_41589 [Fistulina hepatica ATCC 64428]
MALGSALLRQSLVLFYAAAIVQAASRYRLLHRVFDPVGLEEIDYRERGVLVKDGLTFSYQPAASVASDLRDFANIIASGDESPSGPADVLYQLALERDGDLHPVHWDVSSVKLVSGALLGYFYVTISLPLLFKLWSTPFILFIFQCHLQQAVAERFILHVKDTFSLEPFALDYFVSPIPDNGECRREGYSHVAAIRAFASSVGTMDVNITTVAATLPPLPELKTPPSLTVEGEPVQPIPEKTFLQKYWLYIVGILIAMR